MDAAGRSYARPFVIRALPDLADDPDWRTVLQRAFLANGDLESAYYEWRAAVARIDIAAGWPDSNLSLDFEYLFNSENLKAWDRTTLRLGFDPMQNVSLPPKVFAAGRVALDDARAVGRRFTLAKFMLQEQVLALLDDYALLAERIRLQEQEVALLEVAAASATARVAAGASQGDVAVIEAERAQALNELATLRADVGQMRAQLNALVARPPNAPFALPRRLPEGRPLTVPDGRVLQVAAENDPELAVLAAEVAGRADALTLARLQYLPDINPFAGMSGSMEQVVGAAVSLATRFPQIRAAIREARAMLSAGEAGLRQARLGRGAAVVATLVALRDSERRTEVLQCQVQPALEQAAASARREYAAGNARLGDWMEAERARLELLRLVADSRIAREKQLAALETLAGVDFETLTTDGGQARAARASCPSDSAADATRGGYLS